jgi:LacI family transcriptional regulator
MPLVTLGHPCGSRAAVLIDHEDGIRAALDHLVGCGRRRIAMLDTGSAEHPSERGESYLRRLREAGLPERIVRVEETMDGAAVGIRELVGAGQPVDALLAFNDLVAIGALKELQRLGVDVPADCAVIGMDGLSIGAYLTPSLSSLALDLHAMGEYAVDLAVAIAGGAAVPDGRGLLRTVTPTLLLRGSTP